MPVISKIKFGIVLSGLCRYPEKMVLPEGKKLT